MRMATVAVRLILSSSRVLSLTILDILIEARLQTAVSSSEVLRVISVQRFELRTTPLWSCGDLTLQGSLNVIQG